MTSLNPSFRPSIGTVPQQAPTSPAANTIANNNSNSGNQNTASQQNNNAPIQQPPSNAPQMSASDFIAAQTQAQLSAIPYSNVKLDIAGANIELRVGTGNDTVKINFPNGVTQNELSTLIAQQVPGTPESRFYPFEKALLRNFDKIDRDGDGRISARELTLLSAITGGSNNRTITATDFKSIVALPPLRPFNFNASPRNLNGEVSINILGESGSINLPAILTPTLMDQILQRTPNTSPYYPVIFELSQAMFKNGNTRVKTGGFIKSFLPNSPMSGTITPEILNNAAS